MPPAAPITIWHWTGFIAAIVVFLVFDLTVFHRAARPVKPKEGLLWCLLWFIVAMIFAWGLAVWRGKTDALEFITGYFVEYSLSMDNVVAIALIFAAFGVAARHQHRVLFWGILGALVMRGLIIGAGATLIQNFGWVLDVMGAFLVLTGVKWALSKQATVQPAKSRVIRIVRRLFPVANDYDGDKFFTWANGRRALTPLALVLLLVETTDLLFAVDSIPAVFAVTQKAFIVFTSNVFAILGLRSLYFVMAGALQYFRFLKTGLAVVLIFVGTKMLAAHWYIIPTGISLAVVAGIIGVAMGLSFLFAKEDKRT